MTFSDKLRQFADYMDDHPEVASKLSDEWDYPTETIYCEDWDEFQTVIAALGGYEKNGYADVLTAVHVQKDDDDNTVFQVRVSVSGVCEAVPKVDENGQPVMRPKRTFVDSDTEFVQEVEYSCPKHWSER